MPPGLRITAIIAAYNEADIIGHTVGDLVRQGIAAHVLDQHSTDGTLAALEPFVESGLVRIESFPPGVPAGAEGDLFSLTQILARKEQLARDLDADWFINHDADEFRESPWLHLSLRKGIELVDRLGYNAIDFAVLNFWPTRDGFEATSDIREAFQHYESGEAFDRVQIRCWKKTERVDLASSGGHDAQFSLRRVFPVRFILRHYPVRSQAHGTRKVFEERKPRFSDEERRRGWHVQYDAIGPGHQFLRDPTTLRVYDPEEVRVHLQIHHREVERREAEIGSLRLEVDTAAAEARRLGVELTENVRARQELLRRIENLEQQMVDVKQSWSWTLTAPLRALWRLLR
ncbi:MAG: glycosyltransferase family A protein [Vicinamibacterales bacterium]